jgi:hypothetical protein
LPALPTLTQINSDSTFFAIFEKKRGRAMARYRVRFFKRLCDDTGHPHKCLEGVVDIRRARDSDRALRAAKRRFERVKRIPRWDMYADAIEIDFEQDGAP